MRRIELVTRFAAISFLAAFASGSLAADAGAIQQLTGNVTITGADKVTRKASAKEKIQPGDTITTEAKSETLIKMADDSSILLRPNTRFQFIDYKYEKAPTDSSIVNLFRGTARFITGLIGKNNPNNVRVSAVTATIGIRGTDFEVAVSAGRYGGSASGRLRLRARRLDQYPTGADRAKPRRQEEPDCICAGQTEARRGSAADSARYADLPAIGRRPRCHHSVDNDPDSHDDPLRHQRRHAGRLRARRRHGARQDARRNSFHSSAQQHWWSKFSLSITVASGTRSKNRCVVDGGTSLSRRPLKWV